MKISIIMPAHNEEKRISETLESYGDFFDDKLKNKDILDFEIIVVINNTNDKTLDIVKKYSKKYNFIKYLNFKQGGKGFAIIQGWKVALKKDFDLIGFVDADLATSPKAFYDLIKNIKNYDGILASRWLKKSKILTSQPPLRILAGRIFNLFVRSFFLIPYKDTQCGAKLFRKKVIKNIINDLGNSAWAFDVDLIYHIRKKGFKINEFPTIWEDKKESKLKTFKISIQMFSSIVRLRLRYSPLKFIVSIYDKLLPEKYKFHNLN